MVRSIQRLSGDRYVFVLSIFSLFALIADFGYPQNFWNHLLTDFFYQLYATVTFWYLIRFQEVKALLKRKFSVRGPQLVALLSVVLLVISYLNTAFFVFRDSKELNFLTALLVFLIAMFDLSGRLYALNRQTLHPALVFVLSFMVLICLGTLFLMLPNSTVNGISFLDALFTSTSAVCVTGLAVLDTGKDFTRLGQTAILFLIQAGALGMLSFTSLFALLFKGFGSYQTRLNLKDMINADSLESTFRTLIQIIVIVFMIEAVGALLIFYTLDRSALGVQESLFFSIFHSISAFCNAGFSTLTNSLYEDQTRFNYSLHLVIAGLIILGGLGYGVMINCFQYVRGTVRFRLRRLWKTANTERYKPALSLNSQIVLVTNLALLLAGGVLFFVMERNGTLAGLTGWGQGITAFFGSVTTRTAGFNTVDMSALSMSTVMIVLLLMWIGASPGSTGGGIKTTTFAVATLNIVQQVFGFRQIRVGWRRIERGALQRATAIISLSLIMIGLSTLLLVTFDPQLGLMPLAFECFSAYSTVGLSLGITASLSVPSKIVIILTMFIGRVGFLTLLTGVAQQIYKYRYSAIEYPEEKIFIN